MLNNRIQLKLTRFFRVRLVENILIVLILFSVIVALVSIFADIVVFELLNLVFIGFFFVELSLRFFTYEQKGRSRITRYVKDWWVDWLAVIPWELVLLPFVSVAAPQLLRLLRLTQNNSGVAVS